MTFKSMDPELIRQLIADEEDVITPAAEIDAELYRLVKCPACGHQGASKVLPDTKVVEEDGGFRIVQSPFSGNSPIPQGHARCGGCQTEFCPRTRVIVKADQPILTRVEYPDFPR